MSALDQAIIKAYAKDRPSAAPVAAERSIERRAPVAVQQPRADAIEQLYHDGSLYRVEQRGGSTSGNRDVPAPHLPMLPPTSPRRNVRRSMLKLLANSQPAPAAVEPPVESPPRIARKVIIRHISHAPAPPPHGLLRAEPHLPAESISELPPEIVTPEPEPPPVAPAVPAPQSAPLNIDVHEQSLVEVRGTWSEGQAVSPMLLIAEPTQPSISSVSVHLDSLSAAEQAGWAWADVNGDPITTQEPSPIFAAKTLDREEPAVEVRLDAPHALSSHRPHFKIHAEPEQKTEAEITAAPIIAPVQIEPQPNVEAVAEDELTFAESAEVSLEMLASDLVPLDADTDPAPETRIDQSAIAETPAAKPTVPLWEVDKFHWPRTCEKLLADQNGYLARAGDKLLAAVQDGLRVLAVTGSRRGEGRSTLALCLARAAARAGVQTAVMDADFARPQLASKIGLEIAFGWQDAAVGRIPLSEAAVKSLADNVTILPLESSAASRALSLSDPRVTATIRAAAATFELLILDLGPMVAGQRLEFPPGEPSPLDAAIVVRDLRFATVSESETVGHALQDAGIDAVGIAENFVIEEEIPATSV